MIRSWLRILSALAMSFVLLECKQATVAATVRLRSKLLQQPLVGLQHRFHRALTPVPGSPFATGVRPASVAMDPRAAFAYVANRVAMTSGPTAWLLTGP
jgi:hypothetical protein